MYYNSVYIFMVFKFQVIISGLIILVPQEYNSLKWNSRIKKCMKQLYLQIFES